MAKSIIMSEAEEDEPQVSCMLTGYSVERNKIDRTPYYGLRAYETDGKPIDHLVAKKDVVQYLQKYTLLGRKCFLEAMAFITEQTLSIIDTRPAFQMPITEDTAYLLMVRPNIKPMYKSTDDIMERLSAYPFTNLDFTVVQQDLAKNFSSVCINKWQDSIVKFVKKTILKNFSAAQASLNAKDAGKINPYIVRFMKSVN